MVQYMKHCFIYYAFDSYYHVFFYLKYLLMTLKAFHLLFGQNLWRVLIIVGLYLMWLIMWSILTKRKLFFEFIIIIEDVGCKTIIKV